MPKKGQDRVDWMPGRAALTALEVAEQLHPELNRQALIDKLILCGLSALRHEHWRPPPMHGRNRHRWPAPEIGSGK